MLLLYKQDGLEWLRVWNPGLASRSTGGFTDAVDSGNELETCFLLDMQLTSVCRLVLSWLARAQLCVPCFPCPEHSYTKMQGLQLVRWQQNSMSMEQWHREMGSCAPNCLSCAVFLGCTAPRSSSPEQLLCYDAFFLSYTVVTAAQEASESRPQIGVSLPPSFEKALPRIVMSARAARTRCFKYHGQHMVLTASVSLVTAFQISCRAALFVKPTAV